MILIKLLSTEDKQQYLWVSLLLTISFSFDCKKYDRQGKKTPENTDFAAITTHLDQKVENFN